MRLTVDLEDDDATARPRAGPRTDMMSLEGGDRRGDELARPNESRCRPRKKPTTPGQSSSMLLCGNKSAHCRYEGVITVSEVVVVWEQTERASASQAAFDLTSTAHPRPALDTRPSAPRSSEVGHASSHCVYGVPDGGVYPELPCSGGRSVCHLVVVELALPGRRSRPAPAHRPLWPVISSVQGRTAIASITVSSV